MRLKGSFHKTLTPRQVEVLELVNRGLPNAEIALVLGIAHKTVIEHLVQIFARLGARTRCEACYLARRRGLIIEEAS